MKLETPNWKLAVAGLALTALALSPALHHPLLSAAGYAFFSRICHQDTARSFWIFGAPLAVCARCLGIYAGALVGALIRSDRRTALTALLLAVVLNAADVVTEFAGFHGNFMSARFVIGLALGAAISVALCACDKTIWVENDGRLTRGMV